MNTSSSVIFQAIVRVHNANRKYRNDMDRNMNILTTGCRLFAANKHYCMTKDGKFRIFRDQVLNGRYKFSFTLAKQTMGL